MIGSLEHVTLADLFANGELSMRSINACSDFGLVNLQLVLDYYTAFGSFSGIKRCGAVSNLELTTLCERHLTRPLLSNTIINEKGFLQMAATFSSPYRTVLLRHFHQLISNLSVPVRNSLRRISATYDFEEITGVLFNGKFTARKCGTPMAFT